MCGFHLSWTTWILVMYEPYTKDVNGQLDRQQLRVCYGKSQASWGKPSIAAIAMALVDDNSHDIPIEHDNSQRVAIISAHQEVTQGRSQEASQLKNVFFSRPPKGSDFKENSWQGYVNICKLYHYILFHNIPQWYLIRLYQDNIPSVTIFNKCSKTSPATPHLRIAHCANPRTGDLVNLLPALLKDLSRSFFYLPRDHAMLPGTKHDTTGKMK